MWSGLGGTCEGPCLDSDKLLKSFDKCKEQKSHHCQFELSIKKSHVVTAPVVITTANSATRLHAKPEGFCAQFIVAIASIKQFYLDRQVCFGVC